MNPFEAFNDNEINVLPEICTVNQLLKLMEKYPKDAAAITEINGKSENLCSYGELLQRISAMRYAAKKTHATKGEAIGVFYENSIEFAAAVLGVMSFGAIAVLLPASLDEKAVYYLSGKFGLKGILSAGAVMDKLSLTKNIDGLKIIDTSQLDGEACEPVQVSPDSSAAVVLTAGTTGQSKGVLLSHRALTAGMINGIYGYKGVLRQKYYLTIPFTHIFGLVRNLLTCLYTEGTLLIPKSLTSIFTDMAEYNPNIIVTVPALAEMMLKVADMQGAAVLGKELRTIICGAAPVSPYLAKKYSQLGVNLCAGYGLTESANLVSGNPETCLYPESVGYIYPQMDIRVVNDELWIKGSNVMTEYYCDPEATAEAFTEGYFHTGDLVRFDKDGRLYITGRCKDIIVLSTGENISPAELETKFGEDDCIQDCLVYLEKNGSGEQLVLEVLPRLSVIKKKGAADASEYCQSRMKDINNTLPGYMRVNKIIVRTTDFERTPSMKIKRPEQK